MATLELSERVSTANVRSHDERDSFRFRRLAMQSSYPAGGEMRNCDVAGPIIRGGHFV